MPVIYFHFGACWMADVWPAAARNGFLIDNDSNTRVTAAMCTSVHDAEAV
jgi:hypothetical protein